MLDVEGEGWYDFVVNCEHLFLRNIYTSLELKEMDIETTETYCQIIDRLFELYPLFEKALDDSDMSNEFKNLMLERFKSWCLENQGY